MGRDEACLGERPKITTGLTNGNGDSRNCDIAGRDGDSPIHGQVGTQRGGAGAVPPGRGSCHVAVVV